jgi:hypothetical protein
VVGGAVVGGAAVVVGAVVGGVVGLVVADLVVAGRVVATGRRVVVVACLVVVVARRPPEMPWKAPEPGEPDAARAAVVVLVVERLGPVLEGVVDSLAAIVGSGENTVPRASQPGPQRP